MSFPRWTRALILGGALTVCLLSARGLAIVGGHDSSIRDWPSMVALIDSPIGHIAHQYCGGVLIAPQWVLTAGSCLTMFTRGGSSLDSTRAILGATELTAHPRISPAHLFRGVAVFVHPGYGYELTNNDNDLALMKLDKPVGPPYVTLARSAVPATLAELSEATATGQQVIALGWGQNAENQEVRWDLMGAPPLTASGNPRLQQASFPLVTTEQCKKWLRGLGVTDKVICAGREEGGVDTCQGDTGGPLYLVVEGKKKLVGITSFGLGCARPRTPSVYSNVPAAMPWIESVIAKN